MEDGGGFFCVWVGDEGFEETTVLDESDVGRLLGSEVDEVLEVAEGLANTVGRRPRRIVPPICVREPSGIKITKEFSSSGWNSPLFAPGKARQKEVPLEKGVSYFRSP